MMPLSTAVDMYNKNQEVDYILLREHERRLSERIKEAVLLGKPSLRYAVTTIPGPYPPAESVLIAMRLLDSARNVGRYEVRLLGSDPPVLDVSGWEKASKAAAARVAAVSGSAAGAALGSVAAGGRPRVSAAKAPAARTAAPAQELVIVHEDTRGLKKRLQRLNR
jgi:hypothetical protein